MWYHNGQIIQQPRDIEIGGVLYPPAIFSSWGLAELADLGVYPYREEGAPEGMQATAWTEGLEIDTWVRRAAIWAPLPASAGPAPVLSANDFVRRFTAEEQAAIWASAEPQVVLLRNLVLSARDGIGLDDQETVVGMALLVGLGLLTEERSDAILAA